MLREDGENSDFWKNRRVLVAGGAGFIGGQLGPHLLGLGSEVTIADNLENDSGSRLRLGKETGRDSSPNLCFRIWYEDLDYQALQHLRSYGPFRRVDEPCDPKPDPKNQFLPR